MPTRTFWLISASGLAPFLVCLAIAYGSPDVSALHDAAVKTFLVYAALTLSFLGGARWGAELARSPDALGLLILSGGIQLAWDVAASHSGLLPPWNARVRTVMTIAGTLCSLALWPTIA